MSKKPKKGKPPTKKKAVKAKAPSKGGPRSVALPGMGQVRNTRLDNYCESLSEIRAKMADTRADEAGNMQGALTEMHAKGVTTYRHAGVELVRVPGEEKIRVRLSKEKASAETEPDDDNVDLADGTEG